MTRELQKMGFFSSWKVSFCLNFCFLIHIGLWWVARLRLRAYYVQADCIIGAH